MLLIPRAASRCGLGPAAEGSHFVADDAEQKGSFWTSLPGVLTALATLITACTGLYLAIHKVIPTNPDHSVTRPVQTNTVTSPVSNPNEVFQVRDAKVDARNYQQLHCPTTVPMMGTIEGTGRGIVEFRFVLSNGTGTPVQRLEFEPPRMNVSAQLEANRDFRGESQLEILAPLHMMSHTENINVQCR